MKRVIYSLVVLCVLCVATSFAYDVPPGGGPGCWNSNLFIKVFRPSPIPVLFTTNSPVVFRGQVGPFNKVEKVLYSTSAGAAGECVLTLIGMGLRTNACFTSPAIALVAGSNLLTFTAVPLDPAVRPASDHVMVFYNQQGLNHRPVITSRPPRMWGSNEVYSYTLVATDADSDPLALELKTCGPVLATATELSAGTWQIDAALTATNRLPRLRIWIRATVTDHITRPVCQQWPIAFGPRGSNSWHGGAAIRPRDVR